MKNFMLIILPLLIGSYLQARIDIVKIMSSNVRREGSDPEEFQWDNRKNLLLNTILSKKPDIIGFQEVVEGKQLKDLQEGVPEYKSFGIARDRKTGGALQWLVMKLPVAKKEMNPIFYNPEKFQLLSSDAFGINPVDRIFTSWLPRLCQYGEFKNLKTDEIFYVYNTHLDNESKNIRKKQVKMILDHIKKNTNNHPVILMGDLNTKIEGSIKDNLTNALFEHAKKKAVIVKGPNETRTGWHDNELKEIDHILVKNADVEEFETVKSPEGIYPSDHRPIVAKILLP